jgi:hypothetical protein
MGKVKEIQKRMIIKSASHYLCAENDEDLYNEYLNLLQASEDGHDDDSAINHAAVWQPLEGMTVAKLIQIIEDGADEPEHPAFMQNMDWELLKKQKACLLMLAGLKVGGEPYFSAEVIDNLDGIINMLDSIQDYAADVMGLDENLVMDLSKEDE